MSSSPVVDLSTAFVNRSGIDLSTAFVNRSGIDLFTAFVNRSGIDAVEYHSTLFIQGC